VSDGLGSGSVSDGLGSGSDGTETVGFGTGNESRDVDGAGCAVDAWVGGGAALLDACAVGPAFRGAEEWVGFGVGVR